MAVFADSAHAGKGATYAGTIENDRFNINFRIEGTGKPAIVIGFPNFYARTFSQELRSHLRLIFVDHRGSVATQRKDVNVSADYTSTEVIEDVELVRKKLGLDKVAVIGHGGHAYMALEYAIKHPDNVSHVVMIGMPYLEVSREQRYKNFDNLASPERKAIQEENNKKVTNEYLASLPPRDAAVALFVAESPMMFYDPKFNSAPFWEWVDFDDRFLANLWSDDGFGKVNVAEDLKKVKAPVAIVTGPYDFKAPPREYWDAIVKSSDHVSLIYLTESGHVPQHEQAKEFDRQLVQWMNK